MIEIPGRIPILIHPFFWLLATFIGWVNSGGNLYGALMWIGVIFFSVLIHEYGHALTSCLFKQKARIQLVALGGLTSYEGPKLKFWQQFLIVFNGPLFGFFLFLFATFSLHTWNLSPPVYQIFKITQVANLFWTIVNLLPVLPLDGGQLLRIILEASFGIRGFKASLILGAIIATLLAFAFLLIQFYLAGALFFLFAFQSFDLWRKSRIANAKDRDDDNRKLLLEGEVALAQGKKEKAIRCFEQVHQQASGGMLASSAAQYLAILFMNEGKHKEAYDLLLPIQETLGDETLPLMHQLASEYENYPLVAKISATCYQLSPSQEMALRSARAFAHLKEARLSGGWLQAAWKFGNLPLETILKEQEFLNLKDSPEFQQFIEKMK